MSDAKLSDDDMILARSAPSLIPVLERRREGILGKLKAAYYAGTDLRPVTGEYVTICELIRDLETKLQRLQGAKT